MKYWLIIFLLAAIKPGLCQPDVGTSSNFPPPDSPAQVLAIEAKEALIIDGQLREQAWREAPEVSDFFRIEPRQGGSYLYKTSVKIVYDKKNIYLGVFCRDSMGRKGLRIQDLRRDFDFSANDNFYVSFDAQNTKRFCVSFMTTPLGNIRDVQVFDDSFRDLDWDGLWKVRTSITDSGWYAEFAIPFSTIRYNKTEADEPVSWGVSFSRLARRDYEQTAFPAVPQAFTPQRMTYAAELKGLKLPPPSANFRIQPYALYQYRRQTDANSETSRSAKLKTGGEMKWALNPRSVLDLTFNTDFAQADVDRAVNNLTRFNILFPERRQFFLENNGVYAGVDVRGLKPFFSRSIGLANTQFNADPVPIDAGIRFTNRNEKQTLAGLYVHQRGTQQQAGANFAVFRYLRNYGKQSNVGIMFTHRYDESDIDKGFLQRHNTTVSIDGFIRPKDDFNIQYIVTASRNNGGDSIGLAGNFWLEYTPNKLYANWKTMYIDQRYLPGMGFIVTNNSFYNNGGGYFIWRPTKGRLSKLIRRWDPGVYVESYQDARTFRFQNGNIYLFPVYIIFSDNSTLEYAIYPTWEQFFFRPLGIEVTPDRYFFTRQQLRYLSDASRKISASINYFWGDYYNGKLQELNLTLRLAPDPRINFSGSYQLNRLRDLGTNLQNADISLWSAGCRLAINPRIQFSGLYQYNSYDRQGQWNLRGSWEFSPLSFVYIVFNEASFRKSTVQNQSLISKITYLKQF